MPSPPLRLWEQQPGESNAAYAHFRTYRDLGIDRSLDAAYRLWHGQKPEAETNAEGTKGRRASGQWHRECRRRPSPLLDRGSPGIRQTCRGSWLCQNAQRLAYIIQFTSRIRCRLRLIYHPETLAAWREATS